MNGDSTRNRRWWLASLVVAIGIVVPTIRRGRVSLRGRGRGCTWSVHRWSRLGRRLRRRWRNSSVHRRGRCRESRRCDRSVICSCAAIIADITSVRLQRVLVLHTRCNVSVVVALVVTFATLVIIRGRCSLQVGACPACRSRNLRWWWRWWPGRDKRHATRNGRNPAGSPVRRCCVWRAVLVSKVRCSLRL